MTLIFSMPFGVIDVSTSPLGMLITTRAVFALMVHITSLALTNGTLMLLLYNGTLFVSC